MTLEQRIKVMLGERDFAIAGLETELEKAMARIAELENQMKNAPGSENR